jgi:hypothetical protein
MRRRRRGPPLIPGLKWVILALLMVLSVAGFYRWLAHQTPLVHRSAPLEP